MIKIYKFDREEYTLLIIESRNFNISDIEQIRNNYPLVDEIKGVAIVSEPEINKDLLKDIVSHYKSRSKWTGNYEYGFGSIMIRENVDNDLVQFWLVNIKLFCLECFRQDVKTELIKGAKRPYCSKHYHCSPYYSDKRSKKLASKAQPVI